jgi:hypothetical protein
MIRSHKVYIGQDAFFLSLFPFTRPRRRAILAPRGPIVETMIYGTNTDATAVPQYARFVA